MHRFMSKHSSDHYVHFCHNPLSYLAIAVSLYMKFMHTRTYFKLHFRCFFFLRDTLEIFIFRYLARNLLLSTECAAE